MQKPTLMTKHFQEFYQSINHFSGGRLAILRDALATFSNARASHSAAGLAYYAMFSLFPLMLALIALGSYFLDSQQVYQNVTGLVQRFLPFSGSLIDENLRAVLDARGAAGLFSLVALFWLASNVFTNLARDINRAWPEASRRNFLQIRLMGLGMIAGLSVLLILSIVLGWIAKLIPFLNVNTASPQSLRLWSLFSSLGSWLTIFLLYLALYHWIPIVNVVGSASFWSALTASIGWQLATAGFGWYLNSGLGQYQLVYGSIGAIIALLFLIFLISMITLFGAHLCAAIDRWEKARSTELHSESRNVSIEG